MTRIITIFIEHVILIVYQDMQIPWSHSRAAGVLSPKVLAVKSSYILLHGMYRESPAITIELDLEI